MKDRIYFLLPNFLQNLLITLYDYLAYKKRYSGNYNEYLKKFHENNTLSIVELKQDQILRMITFINFANKNSLFYRELYKEIDILKINTLDKLNRLPIVEKELLRSKIDDVYTIPKKKGIVSKTGGTTGKSLEVVFTISDMQERFAMLDNFRSKGGYKLGKKTAWFSGKNLLNKADLKKNRFWKSDYLYNIRYYSTFHIKEEYLKFYVENLLKFQPEYIVGFPSSILEISKYGIKSGKSFLPNVVKGIFPTAETITDEMREFIEAFFNAKIYNQYASSEGAPFIFECGKGNLHFDLQSGVFEVLDDQNKPAQQGKLIVTSFTTHGAPLIRYDIGDWVELSKETCVCGNNNPLLKEILGRIDDYVFSPENGKVNLGNVSNTLKDTKGILKFQVIQDYLDEITIMTIIDSNVFNTEIEKKFIKNWKDRIGMKMKIKINYVSHIPNETSGKYRVVKNNIKHLIKE